MYRKENEILDRATNAAKQMKECYERGEMKWFEFFRLSYQYWMSEYTKATKR